jgi:hypothetical protein
VPLFLGEDEPRRSPMEPGGAGRWFVDLTNRNHCSDNVARDRLLRGARRTRLIAVAVAVASTWLLHVQWPRARGQDVSRDALPTRDVPADAGSLPTDAPDAPRSPGG